MDKFAFVIHPLELSDFTRKFPWMKVLPKWVLGELAKNIPPFRVSHITGIKSRIGTEVEGYFICCPLSSQQMISIPQDIVLEKIIKAGKKAEELGVGIIGLGSFTSVVADKGITVAEELDIAVTTGNSYTVATAIEGTRLAAQKMNINLNDITIVGATGSIGRAVSFILAEGGCNLQLVSRNQNKLYKLKQEILKKYPGTNISYTGDVKRAVSTAKIIISASGAVNSLIEPADLAVGSVVCDVARPRDVADRVGKTRDDVLVIEGGVVKVPGNVNFNFDFGYPPRTAYACMAETMFLTLEKKFINYSLGPELDLMRVKESLVLAKKHGFELSGLRSFEKPLSGDKIKKIRENALKKSYCYSNN